MRPFVSIIIPTKNAAEHLDECLSSIGMLAYPSDARETIIVDGGSTDGTKLIAEKHGATVIEGSAEGPTFARFQGVQRSKGSIVAFTDADAIVDAEWLTNAVRILQEEPNVTGVGGAVLHPPQGAFASATQVIFDAMAGAGISNDAADLSARKTVQKIGSSNFIIRIDALRALLPWTWKGYGGDLVLSNAIRSNGGTLVQDPCVIVKHYKRSTPYSLFVEMAKWGHGRSKMTMAFADKAFVHLAVGFSLPLALIVVPALIMAAGTGWIPWAAGIAAVPLVTFACWAARRKRSALVALLFPVAVIAMACGWSVGFTAGRILRLSETLAGGRAGTAK